MTYRSVQDWGIWVAAGSLVAACAVLAGVGEYAFAVLTAVLGMIMGLWAFNNLEYTIKDGDLTVRDKVIVRTYPISEIREIRETRSWACAPAVLRSRIAVTFKPGVTRGSQPLIISPARRADFLAALLEINPSIRINCKA